MYGAGDGDDADFRMHLELDGDAWLAALFAQEEALAGLGDDVVPHMERHREAGGPVRGAASHQVDVPRIDDALGGFVDASLDYLEEHAGGSAMRTPELLSE